MTPDWRMTREIAEQSKLFSTLVDDWKPAADEICEEVRKRDKFVVIGRGSSRNACVYASYLYGVKTGRHATEFRMWMTTRDVPRADWSDAAVLAYSASGQSTDIARAAKWLSERGAFVVGVTNAPDAHCALGEAADRLFHLGVGQELAVPATKSFNAQLLASAALLGFEIKEPVADVCRCLDRLDNRDAAKRLADVIEDARTVAWIARGPTLGAARDAALKCRESARLDSTGWSSAEIQHGYIGSLGERDRAVIFSDANQPAGSFSSIAKALLNRGIPYAVVGLDYYETNGGPAAPVLGIDLPKAPWARAPVFAYLSQQTALELAQRKGLNPDSPAGLQKVTETV